MSAVREFLISRQPLRRQGRRTTSRRLPRTSPANLSSFVTGTLLPVDGGILAGNPATSDSFETIHKRAKGWMTPGRRFIWH